MGSERLSLRWNDFESNIKRGFAELRKNEELFDVILVCGNRQIQAHKVILSACSSFFHSIITSFSHSCPLLYLKDIKFSYMKSLLDFMYNGEVNVDQDDIDDFLTVAQELQIKGLSQTPSNITSSKNSSRVSKDAFKSKDNFKKEKVEIESLSTPVKRPRVESNNENENDDDDEIQDITPIKTEFYSTIFRENENSRENPNESEPLENNGGGSGSSEGAILALKQAISLFVIRDEHGVYSCKKCSRTFSQRTHLTNHIEAKHIKTDGFECTVCKRVFKTRNSLNVHNSTKHANSTLYISGTRPMEEIP